MPKPNIVLFDKKNVHTTACNFLIKKENFPKALEKLRSQYKELSDINSIPSLLEKLNWEARSVPEGINKLIFNQDVWTFSAYLVIKILSPFVENDSYIQILNLSTQHSWLYKFYNGKINKVELSGHWLDLSNKNEMLNMFKLSTTKLASMNVSRKILQDILDYLYLKELL